MYLSILISKSLFSHIEVLLFFNVFFNFKSLIIQYN
nr:MAG TPA: hypothetical protein [Bacteriophage sp.]